MLSDYYPGSVEMRFHYKRIAVITLVLVGVSLSVFILTQFGTTGWFGSKRVRKKKIVTIQDKIEEELSK